MTTTAIESQHRCCLVTGLGIVCAAGNGVDAFRRAIVEGRSGAQTIPKLRSPRHQPPVGAPVPESALPNATPNKDRAFVMAEQAAREALSQAGLAAGAPSGSGLILGTTLGGVIHAQRWHAQHLTNPPGNRSDLLAAPLDAVADHVARRLGLDGPRTVISNACVSGTNAVGQAFDLIRCGEADLVLAGGVDSLHSFNFAGFANLGALSSRGHCEPFDPAGRGMLLGEAAAFLVLESASSAARSGRVALAEIAGYGSACDAFHVTAPSRDGCGARLAIENALADADEDAAAVDLVLLHGVGTAYMDAMEAVVMADLCRDRDRALPVVSLRPVTGHTLGGVGAVDTIASVLAVREGFIPPTGNAGARAPNLPSRVRLTRGVARQPVGVVLNTSSGFGGVNAAVVVRSCAVSAS